MTSKLFLFCIVLIFAFYCCSPRLVKVDVYEADYEEILNLLSSILVEEGFAIKYTDKSLGIITTDYKYLMTGVRDFAADVLRVIGNIDDSDPVYQLSFKIETRDNKITVKITSTLKSMRDATNGFQSKIVLDEVKKIIEKLSNYSGKKVEAIYL